MGGESKKKSEKSILTASSADQEKGGGEVSGPFIVNITLSELPLLNRTTIAVIDVHNPTSRAIDNVSIRLRLYRRLSLHNYWERELVWERVLWSGALPPSGHMEVSDPITIGKAGYYYATGWALATRPGYYPFSTVFLHLNVSENQTIVTPGMGPLESEPPPPPAIPYLIKMDLDGVPALNRPVNLRVTIASLMDVRNATFRIFLPEGFELVSGDLVWQGGLQKAMDETEIGGPSVTKDKIPEATLQRIPEDKKVRMRATIRPTLRGDAHIFVFPSQERPPQIDCYLNGVGLGIPHPLIGKEVSGGWQAVSYGGCLNVRVFNETDGAFSEQELPWVSTKLFRPPPGGQS